MSEVLLPTTRAQVSGHRFLRRRVEHALVLGDLRMIHDPLARRQRALLFGVVAVVLIGLGAGLLALLRPTADPGDAPILRADSGALFVRAQGILHPVHNLASARLVAGQPATPARIADDVLLTQQLGAPVGLIDAPGILPAEPPGQLLWSVCEVAGGEQIGVLSGPSPRILEEREAVLVDAAGHSFLLTVDGRFQLPAEQSREGRVIRRALGITAATPRWEPRPVVLEVAKEGPELWPPEGVVRILQAGDRAWLETEGGLGRLSELQAEILADLGAPVEEVPRELLADQPDDPEPPALALPEHPFTWVDPVVSSICLSGEDGTPGTLEQLPGAVALPGESVAQFYAGPPQGSVAVDTGSGYRVVSESGLVHQVASTDLLEVLGLSPEPAAAPWSILRLLPQGADLDPRVARQVKFSG